MQLTDDFNRREAVSAAALRESQDDLRLLIDSVADAVYCVDREGATTLCNVAFLQMLGFDDEKDVIGIKLHDVIHHSHPDGSPYPKSLCPIYRTAQTGEPAHVDGELFYRADGGSVPVEYWARPIVRDGELQGAVCTFVDVSERRAAEAALRASEDRFRTLFTSAPMALFVCDRNAVIQDYNRRAADLWGREPVCGVEQHCGSAKLWLLDGTALPHAQSPIVEVLRTGIPAFNVEVFIERPDGSRVPVLVNFAALTGAQGEITGAITSFVDITERKATEAALRTSEQQFRALADAIPQLAWIADAEGEIYWYNQRWFDYTGTHLEAMKDWGWREVHHPDHIDRIIEEVQGNWAAGKTWEGTYQLRSAAGEYRWFLTRAEPIRNEAGELVRWFGTNTDIDDQRRDEERRQLLLNEMNHRVKNLFAVMGGVVTLSARSADTPQAMAKIVAGRLNALAHAHKLIAPALSGNGMANQESTLGQLVRATLAPHLDPESPDDDARAVIEGPEVPIGGEAVTSLALILHELATNAAKYGAFSSPKGRVHVAWSVKKGKLALSWQESGGPKVKGAPTREGFGSLLARRSAAGQLGGELAFEWKSEGLIVRFSAAAERLGTMNG